MRYEVVIIVGGGDNYDKYMKKVYMEILLGCLYRRIVGIDSQFKANSIFKVYIKDLLFKLQII